MDAAAEKKITTKKIIKLVFILVLTVIIWNIPTPAGLKTEIWHMVAIYLAVLLGLIIKPLPAPVITLIIVGFAMLFVKKPEMLLSGYSSDMTWFIWAVTIVATAFIKTGLGNRIAYNLLMRAGNSTLGLGYLLVLADLILSPATGSNSARISIIYPIFQNIAEGVDSYPNKNPRRLGGFFTILSYVSSQGTSAIFMTGMATNAISVSLIAQMAHIHLTWTSWFLAAVVPAGLFLLAAPYVVYKLYKPELTELTDVKKQAQQKLQEMGPMSGKEKTLFIIFILAILGWIFGPKLTFIALSTQAVGFVFLGLLFLTGLLNWKDAMGVKGAWNILVWYGAFYGIASSLADGGFYNWLADVLSKAVDLSHVNGLLVTVILLLISIVVRYFFVSTSAFAVSFLPVILSMAANTRANLSVLSLLLAFFVAYGALLTHYGNGAGLIVFASDYVSQKEFWKIGTVMAIVALFIFLVIGLPYWKLIGIW